MQMQLAEFSSEIHYTSDWQIEADGHTLSHEVLASLGYHLFDWHQPGSDNSWWDRPLKWGEVGCTIAHVQCWDAIANSSAPAGIVLEDDIRISPNSVQVFVDEINALRRSDVCWDIIYLGRFPIDEPKRLNDRMVQPGYSHCTFGYVVTREAAAKMLALQPLQAIIPADEFLPAMYLEHPRLDVRRRFPPSLMALAFDPPLVTQLPKDVAGSDTEATRFV